MKPAAARPPGRGPEVHIDRLALRRFRRREADDEAEPPDEGGVQVRLAVGGEHGQPVELLHLLEHVVDLDVRVPVVRVADLGPLAEKGVGLVE